MDSMIKELWSDYICMLESGEKNTPEMRDALQQTEKYRDELVREMTEEQRTVFAKFGDCLNEYTSLTDEVIFAEGVKVGARLMMEVLSVQ